MESSTRRPLRGHRHVLALLLALAAGLASCGGGGGSAGDDGLSWDQGSWDETKWK